MTMDTPTVAINQVAKEFGISEKLARAYTLIDELEPILDELKEYGFVSPSLYIAPFGNGTSERGKAYVSRAYNLMLELDAEQDGGGIGMSGKVKVTKELAKAIEKLRERGFSNSDILIKAVDDTPLANDEEYAVFEYVNGEGEDSLMYALINGYEYEKTSDDLLREYYESLNTPEVWELKKRQAVEETLNILGIKIEGVNA